MDYELIRAQQELSNALCRSNLLPATLQGSPANILLVIMKGHELQLSPIQSIDCIHIIKGKPTMSAQGMLALIKRDVSTSKVDVQVFRENKEGGGFVATCTMHRGEESHTCTWDMERAYMMGLTGKDNWKKQPDTMLKWRAVSECARFLFPDVIMGLYTPEELDSEEKYVYNEQGEIAGTKEEADRNAVKANPCFTAIKEKIYELWGAGTLGQNEAFKIITNIGFAAGKNDYTEDEMNHFFSKLEEEKTAYEARLQEQQEIEEVFCETVD